MKQKVVTILITLFVLTSLFTGCGKEANEPENVTQNTSNDQQKKEELKQEEVKQEEKIVFKYGELNPEGHPMAMAAEEFARLVDEKSNGSMVIEVYAASQLGDEKTTMQSLQMGAVDFFRANTVSLGDFGADKCNVFALPYVFRDRDHIWDVLNSEIGDEILNSVQESGSKLVGIGYVEEGSRNFFFTEDIGKIDSISDLKGVKIRVPETQIMMDTVAAFGASPTPISYSELYSALQTGVVDGAENPPNGYLANNFFEVAPYYTLDGHTYSPGMVIMSELSWNKLNKDQQAIVKDAMDEVEVFVKNLAEEKDKEALAALEEKGAIITQVANKKEWQDAVRPVYEKYGSDYIDIIDRIANEF